MRKMLFFFLMLDVMKDLSRRGAEDFKLILIYKLYLHA